MVKKFKSQPCIAHVPSSKKSCFLYLNPFSTVLCMASILVQATINSYWTFAGAALLMFLLLLSAVADSQSSHICHPFLKYHKGLCLCLDKTQTPYRVYKVLPLSLASFCFPLSQLTTF